ncbi:MAG: hypothetical protein JXJ19_05205 [Elusimicrobia bacterium]|nr:hypothetical protein [Elusimicrobiota bacterium]
MKKSICLIVLMLTASSVFAESADYQLRVLLHKQHYIGKSAGLAGWWVLPDVTVEDNEWKSLVVAGPLFKYADGWIEVMGGAMIPEVGENDPVVNIRVLNKKIDRLGLFGDFEYFFEFERFYFFVMASTPLTLSGIECEVGIESENIIFPDKDDSYGIGPRLGIKFPWYKKASLCCSYEFRNDTDFIRNYILVNF